MQPSNAPIIRQPRGTVNAALPIVLAQSHVIPAQAGIQWTPACAGVTGLARE
jgi:hypothetical protein